MNVGVEVLGERFDDYARTKLLAIRPALVKCRHPAVAGEVLGLLPGVRVLARTPGEGYELGDLVDGYQRWLPTLQTHQSAILAFELGNEVNHPSKHVDPNWWTAQATSWLSTQTPPVPLCTPGLVPHVRIDEWRAALDQLPVQYRGIHAYWQQEGPEAGVQNALAQAAGVTPSRILCTEFNTAHSSEAYHPSLTERAEECIQAVRALAGAGVPAAALFALTGWQDWGFTFDASAIAQIIAAGTEARPSTPRPPRPRPTPVPPEAPMQSPNHGGNRPQTTGVVIHSTRGGQTYGVEYQATLNWFASPASQVSAHAVVSRTGDVAYPVPDGLIAWHAGEHNNEWLGIELEQPTVKDDFTEEQYQAAAAVVRRWCEQYGIPIDRQHLRGHEEMPQGVRSGKSDPGPLFSWWRFLQYVQAGEPEPTVVPDALAHLDAAWGHTIEAGKLTRSVRIREHLLQAQDELVLAKQAAGWE